MLGEQAKVLLISWILDASGQLNVPARLPPEDRTPVCLVIVLHTTFRVNLILVYFDPVLHMKLKSNFVEF
jgi:hypothetical protein